MKTSKLIILVSLLVLGVSIAQGQKKRPSKEQVEALRVAFITKKLNLTSKEAQVFWPIHNEFSEKMRTIHKQLRKLRKDNKDLETLTDEETEKLVDKHIELRQKELDIQKEYHAKFKEVLPIKKVALLYKAEDEFKRDLLRKLKDHKGGGGPPHHPHGGPPH